MRLKVKPKPHLFEKRTMVKFAWFPIRIEDTIIWLEKYECTYRYEKNSFWDCYYWDTFETKLLNKPKRNQEFFYKTADEVITVHRPKTNDSK